MENDKNEEKRKSKKRLKQDSVAYKRHREKANARKRKFLDNMTPEQKEMKRLKDREYYQRKKAEKKVKTISDMTEREKRKQRKSWREYSQKYRQKKKMMENILADSPPASENEMKSDIRELRKKSGRKRIKKDRAQAYRIIKKQKQQIQKMQKSIDKLRKKVERNRRREERASQHCADTPTRKVDEITRECFVTPEVRKHLLFGQVLTAQLKDTAENLPKNSKQREAFQKCVSGNRIKKHRLSYIAKQFLYKNKNKDNILISNRRRQTLAITQQIREDIHKFFERDDVSRICSGKKDCLKGHKQKRLLLETVKTLQPQFCAETGIQVSYATLLREKPYWVVHPTKKDRDTCLCVRHENFEYKLNKLNRLGELHNSTSQLIKTYSCDITSYDCMFGLCDNCKEIKMESGINEDTVQYFQWQITKEDRIIKGEKKTIKLTKKGTITSTVKDLKMSLAADIPLMKKHVYGIGENLKAKRELRDNLKETELMIQIDFAENYMTKYGKEIQSIRFGASKGQLSIHTGVLYAKKDTSLQTVSFATVSDNLDHQAHAVWGHLKSALQKILDTRPHVNTLHVFSDGPTSQYRNRTNIYLWIKTLTDQFPQITASTWTFSEPGHGKGPMDGVGGVLKKTADDHVLRGNDVNTAADFVRLLKKSTILLHEVTDDEIVAIKNLIPEKIDAIPGIMNVTKIVWQNSSDVSILLYQFSKLLRIIKLQAFSIEDRGIESPAPSEIIDLDIEMNREVLNRVSIYNAVYGSDTSDDENLQTISDRLHGKNHDNGAGTSYGEDKENLHPNLIRPKTFLLVNVPTENENFKYRYVAVADTSVDEDGEIKVTFLRCQQNSTKMFKMQQHDVSYVTYEQVVKILPTPKLQIKGSRSFYYFDESMDIFEK
ncbi:uncharacterized protein LOC115456138 [Manduca sexta]|uniref:Uncharacterized protein n=1 Tax=Manduca sexta TaxID=7130 RepID=A0A922CFR3_MANSE|nr:uncharacterized protein LOC115456138 [Manduca sexta]KAG6443763.1 hypothetical protein O3G_MSEX003041 [Manduca sexta]